MAKSLPIQDFAWVEVSEALPEFEVPVILAYNDDDQVRYFIGCLHMVVSIQTIQGRNRTLEWGMIRHNEIHCTIHKVLFWAPIPPINTPHPQ